MTVQRNPVTGLPCVEDEPVLVVLGIECERAEDDDGDTQWWHGRTESLRPSAGFRANPGMVDFTWSTSAYVDAAGASVLVVANGHTLEAAEDALRAKLAGAADDMADAMRAAAQREVSRG